MPRQPDALARDEPNPKPSLARRAGKTSTRSAITSALDVLVGQAVLLAVVGAVEQLRRLVAGVADEAHLALLLGLQGLGQGAPLHDPVGVVVVVDLVELPQVEDVGAKAAQGVLQVLPCAPGVAGAVLGHQETLLAL